MQEWELKWTEHVSQGYHTDFNKHFISDTAKSQTAAFET